MSVHLSVCSPFLLFVCLPVGQSTGQSICLPVFWASFLSVCSSTRGFCLSAHLCAFPSFCLSVHLPIHLPACMLYLSVCSPIPLFVCLSACPSVGFSDCLSILFVCPPAHTTVCLSASLPICLCISLKVYLSISQIHQSTSPSRTCILSILSFVSVCTLQNHLKHLSRFLSVCCFSPSKCSTPRVLYLNTTPRLKDRRLTASFPSWLRAAVSSV